jgi:hypothetical protein
MTTYVCTYLDLKQTCAYSAQIGYITIGLLHGCQMVYFHTKNPYFGSPRSGKFWYILWSLCVFYGNLVHFVVNWYIFPRFGMLYREKIWQPWFPADNRQFKIRNLAGSATAAKHVREQSIYYYDAHGTN